MEEIPLALSYDDVMLVPQRSTIRSRRDVDTTTRLTRNVRIAMPIVAANMDTVTESGMAIAMARAGGIGIIHRFLTVEDQAREVRRVKRAEALKIEDPLTIRPEASLDEARRCMADHGVNGLVVVDASHKLAGMLTRRDLHMGADARTVADAMTPRARLATGAPDVAVADALAAMRRARVEKLPLVDDDEAVRGLVTMKDLLQHAQRPKASKLAVSPAPRWATISGASASASQRASVSIAAGSGAATAGRIEGAASSPATGTSSHSTSRGSDR